MEKEKKEEIMEDLLTFTNARHLYKRLDHDVYDFELTSVMRNHIEFSYCKFDGFKVLAKNCLNQKRIRCASSGSR
ncbi:hypothetical protein F511_00617 [Dorcoceras hygrometricum]|nr:hypothetical protein F511_00617 [Dorcoceras hygrometricum]